MNKTGIFSMLLFTALVLVTQTSIAQTPVNDPSWILQTGSSEEFNSALNFTTKWYNQYPWGGINGGGEINYPANLDQSTGTTLKIKVDTLNPAVHVSPSNYALTDSVGVTYVYQGGAMESRLNGSGNSVYKFGYIEIYAKFPTGVYSLWPAFWLWRAECSSPNYSDEIDIAENPASITYNGYQTTTNVHVYQTGICGYFINSDAFQQINGLPLLSSAFHKYGLQWSPDKLSWYFDDVPIRTLYDASGTTIPQHAMDVILSMGVDPWHAFLPNDWNTFTHDNKTPTGYPKNFEIDYLRYYKLNTDCNTNLTICTPSTDYGSRAVEKSILTGGSCSPTFNTSSTYTLRATDYITLDAGTTINADGSGFFAVETLVCPQ